MIGRLVALVLLLAAGGSPAAASPRRVELTIHFSRFDRAVVRVPGGARVIFVVHNTDPIDHELIVGDAALQRAVESGNETRHDGAVPGQVSVPAGTTSVTEYVVDRTVQYACHAPGHWTYGMSGVVIAT